MDELQLVCNVVAAMGGAKFGTVKGTNSIGVLEDPWAKETVLVVLQLQEVATTGAGCATGAVGCVTI